MCVCPSIFSLDFMDEQLKIEAHDSEVLCLSFSPASTGESSALVSEGLNIQIRGRPIGP